MNSNIIIIIIDALRPKNLSLFGYEKETDKNLKKIANENIFFTKHFSCSNSTYPSLTSLFTGKYPDNHGIIHQFPYTKDEEIKKLKQNKFWLPLYLKNKGYDTIALDWMGFWFKSGFNYYKDKEERQDGLENIKESKIKRILNLPLVKKILLKLPNWIYRIGKKLIKTRASVIHPPYNETADLAISKIKESKENKKPFFLFMHFWDTHFPFPSIDYKPHEKKDIKQILKSIKNKNEKEYLKKRITDIGLYSVQDIINKYDLAIKKIDNEIGRIYEVLKSENLWENTCFIVLADHGENLTEHGIYFNPSGLYEPSIHVPLIMHLPRLKPKKINEFVQNIDITPTLLDYIGEKKISDLDGKSLLPLIKTNKKIRDRIFAIDGLSADIKTVRTEKRKLIIAKDNHCYVCKGEHHKQAEEYDLEKDPEELNNIYSESSELKRFLDAR